MKKYLLVFLALGLALAYGASKDYDQQYEGGEGKTFRIGIVQFMDHVSLDQAREGFLERLQGEGINYQLVNLSANGDMTLIPTLAQKLKGRNLDLIYTIATPAAQGVKNQIKETPIVFSAVTDPVGAGLVESLERQGANVTGVSDYMDPIKQVESFLQLYPHVKTFGVIYNTSEQNSQVQVEELEGKLAEKKMSLVKVGITSINDIPQSIASLSSKIDAYFALTDNLVANAAPIVSENLNRYKIPSLSAEEGQVKGGLLMSEGVNYKEQGSQAAELALKILQGESPGSLPVEYNRVNRKLVNKQTAYRLGLDLTRPEFKGADLVDEGEN